MRIDLLVSNKNEIGILSDEEFASPVSAIIYDEEKHALHLEFAQTMESIKCNIPVANDFSNLFEDADEILVGSTQKKVITDVRAVPIGTKRLYRQYPLSIPEYESFWGRVNRAQPLHRESYSEEELASVTREIRGSQLQFTKELRYNLSLQAAPRAPSLGPSLAPGPKPPGMPPGMSNNPTMPRSTPRRGPQGPSTPPTDTDE